MIWKKGVAALLAVLFCLQLSACGESTSVKEDIDVGGEEEASYWSFATALFRMNPMWKMQNTGRGSRKGICSFLRRICSHIIRRRSMP